MDLAEGHFSSLEAHPNAGSLHVNLGGSAVDELDIQMNAGSLSLQTDAGTQLAAPGLAITSTPRKPTSSTVQRVGPTFSCRK